MTATLTLVCEAIGSQHQFGPNGGAFGRSRKCDWVLPDQDRHLSSVHARILFQNDAFILVDESTNGTFLEGQSAAIGRGKAVSLSAGMTLRAGPYQIRVDSVQSGQATQTNPFAAPAFSGRPAPAPTPLRIDTSGASLPKNTSLDPLDHLGGGSSETLTPVASVQTPQNLIPEPVSFSAPAVPASPHETTRFQGEPPVAGQAAPPAFQPAPVVTTAAPSPAVQTAPSMPGAPAAPAAAGLAPAPTQAPTPASIPVPAAMAAPSPPQTPAAGQGNLIPEDFLASLGAGPGAAAGPGTGPVTGSGNPSTATAAQPQPGLPDLSALMPAATGAQASSPATPAAPPSAPSSGPAIIPDNIDFGVGAAGTVSAPAAPPPTASSQAPSTQPPSTPGSAAPALPRQPGPLPSPVPAAAPEAPLNPLDALKKRRAQREAELAQKAKARSNPAAPVAKTPPAAAAPAARPASPAPAMPRPPVPQGAAGPKDAGPALPAATEEVFQALLSGLGFANADVPPEERAEIARATGEMVRELANGLISLLNARKSLKTEFRMYETRIQPEENNPFKHFNVGELAIDEMLFARKGGFLPPPEAAREAFKDLQGHTMLTVAATQRAMRMLFESLSPETLAGEEDDGGLRLRGLGSRRGKFEAAKERHDRLRADFDAVVRQTIAEAFVQVEEDQARQQSKTFWENRKK